MPTGITPRFPCHTHSSEQISRAMKKISPQKAAQVSAGGKFCDFVQGADLAVGTLGLLGAPIPGGRITGGALLAANAYCAIS